MTGVQTCALPISVQIVPNIQPSESSWSRRSRILMTRTGVSTLKCFIRSASWVTAGFGQRFAGKGGSNFKCSATPGTSSIKNEWKYIILTKADNEKQRQILKNDPQKYLAYRKKIESELNSRFRFILNGSEEQANARAVSPHPNQYNIYHDGFWLIRRK